MGQETQGGIELNTVEADKKVIRTGGSLALRLTKELSLMNIKEGDVVHITIEKRVKE